MGSASSEQSRMRPMAHPETKRNDCQSGARACRWRSCRPRSGQQTARPAHPSLAIARCAGRAARAPEDVFLGAVLHSPSDLPRRSIRAAACATVEFLSTVWPRWTCTLGLRTCLACQVAEFARIRAIRCRSEVRSPKSGDFGYTRGPARIPVAGFARIQNEGATPHAIRPKSCDFGYIGCVQFLA